MAFAEDYRQRETALEQAGDELRQDRDKAIRSAYDNGLPMAAIAQIMGMSHQRISQIIRR